MTEESDNLFDDTATDKPAEGDSATFKDNAEGTSTKTDKDNGLQTAGDTTTTGTPPDGKDGKDDSGNEKMIPESRFKAALKDVTDKYTATQAELNRMKAVPEPDKIKDPEGYNLHVRIETSKSLMREMKPDYDDVIGHYKKMADVNPDLNVAVAKAAIPAKFAYDLAKKDMELSDLAKMKDSDEYKEFLTARKAKADAAGKTDADAKAGKQVAAGLGKVPNLNRATNVSRGTQQSEDSDELFSGAL